MSTRDRAISIIDYMTEEQLQGFIMMFGNLVPTNELDMRINDIENGKNLSKEFNSISELMEDLLGADD